MEEKKKMQTEERNGRKLCIQGGKIYDKRSYFLPLYLQFWFLNAS